MATRCSGSSRCLPGSTWTASVLRDRDTGTSQPGQRVFDVSSTAPRRRTATTSSAMPATTGVMKSFSVVSDGTLDVAFTDGSRTPCSTASRSSAPTARRRRAPTPCRRRFSGTSVPATNFPDTASSGTWPAAPPWSTARSTTAPRTVSCTPHLRRYDVRSGDAGGRHGPDRSAEQLPHRRAHHHRHGLHRWAADYTLNGDSHLYYGTSRGRATWSEGEVHRQQRHPGHELREASGISSPRQALPRLPQRNLQRSDFVNGTPTGTGAVVSGPGVDGTDCPAARCSCTPLPAVAGATSPRGLGCRSTARTSPARYR